jgi:hypothetical protein
MLVGLLASLSTRPVAASVTAPRQPSSRSLSAAAASVGAASDRRTDGKLHAEWWTGTVGPLVRHDDQTERERAPALASPRQALASTICHSICH